MPRVKLRGRIPSAPEPFKEGGPRPKSGGFAKGNGGKPKGATNKVTRAVEEMMGDSLGRLTARVIKLAFAGDATAMKIVFDRVAPVRRGRMVKIDLPPITDAAGVKEALGKLTSEAALGTITPEEAWLYSTIIDVQRRGIELGEVADRLKALEDKLGSEREP
ncbi:hypothetical protein [Acidisoma sp. S159]|uniref:hypothetical protein n=1 Tax=Acidisoma sp. S159 TaxID=1747225 RepID=UPI00131AD1FF|nr:hypothetical protein [Acidisoma sp. S159]